MAGEQCNRCGNSNVKFKFFNNKKVDQPRYQCLDCTAETGKAYFFNPHPKRQNHKDGYAKLPKEETEELKNLEKVCDKCGAVNNAKFRGYNNGNMNQPRYVCRGCNRLFSPLKKSKAVGGGGVETAESSSNQFQTQSGATSEASHQQITSLQQQIPPGFQPTHLQNFVQNNYNHHQRPILPQQIALENQQPYFQEQFHYYPSNPLRSSQQQNPTEIPLSHFQNNHTTIQQQQTAPRFQQPHHQPLVHDNPYNQRNFQQQQQLRTEIQQPYYSHPSFPSNLRDQRTITQQQQIAPRNHQQQSRIPQNYCNPQETLAQQPIPTGLQECQPQTSFQINYFNQSTYLIPSANQQTPFQPASQSNSNHPDAQDLGISNEEDPASLPANWSRGASPLTHQSSVPFTEGIPEECKAIFEDAYFKDMLNSHDLFDHLTKTNDQLT